MQDDYDFRDNGVHMEDPVWRLLNGLDDIEDDCPEPLTSQKRQTSIISILCIGAVPPLIFLAIEYLF